jgi:hypothetical protein
VGFQGRYRRKARFNLIDRESIVVVVVVNLESPRLLLVYVVSWFRSEEMTKGVPGEALLRIERIEFKDSSFKLGESQSKVSLMSLRCRLGDV